MKPIEDNKQTNEPLLTIYILAGGGNQKWLLESANSIAMQINDLPIALAISINTPAISPNQLASEVDRRIRIRSEPLRVPADMHLRHCADACTSQYIMLFHDDDLIAKGYLKTAVALLQSASPDLLTSDMRFFSDSGQDHETIEKVHKRRRKHVETITREELIIRMLRGDPINFASCIYRTKNLQTCRIDELSKLFGKYADRPLMLESAGRAGRVLHCTGGTVFTRIHGSQDSQQLDPMAANKRTALLAYYRHELEAMSYPLDRYWLYACWRALHDCMSLSEWISIACLKTNDRSKAISLEGIAYWVVRMSKELIMSTILKFRGTRHRETYGV